MFISYVNQSLKILDMSYTPLLRRKNCANWIYDRQILILYITFNYRFVYFVKTIKFMFSSVFLLC